ncbi:MAG TPA: PAS domain S-box protein [Steroidobacteraceae bacterium]|nr:PAS domain S-box protein [Steroidobacteraceae bacterium]
MISKTPAEARPSTQPSIDADARLRALTEHALEIITVQDDDGAFTYVNEAVLRHLGYPAGELLGRNAIEFLHPDDAEAMRQRFRSIMSARAAPDLNRFEYRFRHANGTWCWLESVAVNALANPAVNGIIAHSRDINLRKADERILSLNHARYRTVADLSDGAVHEFVMNAVGEYELEWTMGAPRVYGCSEDEYRRLGWRHFLVGDGWEAESLARTARYLSGETVEFTAQIRRTDGHIRWIEVRNRPIAEPGTGKFTRLVGVAVDVTERKTAADALRESEFRYRTVAELTSGFVYEATVDEFGEAQVVWASPGWNKFFGGPYEELNRVGWRKVFLPNDHASAIGRRQRIRRGESTEMELRMRTLGGETRWVHMANQPIVSNDGSITRYIGVVHDITDRKTSEEVLRTQALAIEVMNEGVVLSDADGHIHMTNPAFDRMFRRTRGELLGRHMGQLGCEPPLNGLVAEFGDDTGARAGAPLVCELTLRGPDDHEGTLFVEAAITSLVLGGERYWLTMLQDATARRQLEREVLEVSNREQQRIGNDLHDGLGQELTGIALLLRGLENRAEREAPSLSAAIEEVALLVNDAIFTTRALARGLSPVTFDRGGLAFALEELARRLSAMFHIDVRCEADHSLDRGLTSTNALHLYRIAQEAVTNAAQHGHADRVSISLALEGDRGLLRIEDNGSGFTPALHQSKGLGLRIMHYRTQMMAGSLRIETARPRGTIVCCRFPHSLHGLPEGS